MHRRKAVAAIAALGLAALSACSSAGGGGGPGSPDGPIKLGVLTSLTGPSASSYDTLVDGVKARIGLANAEGGVDGRKLEYVAADDASTSTGAVSAMQKLVEVDNVFGVLAVSGYLRNAAAVAKAAGVPVVGANFDQGPEWNAANYPDFFEADGYDNYNVVTTTFGEYFKSVGATKVGAVGYGSSPTSSDAVRDALLSAKAAGLQDGILDLSLPFGSTDVGPIIQKIKQSGTDALYVPLTPSSAYAIAQGLEQAGVHMKSVLLAAGYSQGVLADPATTTAAQGLDFPTDPAPVEKDTAATRQLQAALKTYAGVTGIPSFAEYLGWLTADAFIYGLKQAGAGATQAKFITALRHSTWNSGLSAPTDFSHVKAASVGEDQDNCFNVVRLEGDKFVPRPGASPICGKVIPGLQP
jgi:ABC-type branched-subunit amino acid transport system substrate-binding protein